MSQWLVIGIGNEFRGDDLAGCLVARTLNDMGCGDTRVIEHQGDGTALLPYFREADKIIIIDAVRSGKPPGFIHRLDLLTDSIPVNFIHDSSHLFGVVEAVALARELHHLPSRLILYGIEGKLFEVGGSLSPEVQGSVIRVARRIIDEITAERGENADVKRRS